MRHSIITPEILADYAVNARRKAFTPYTGFNVGAAVLSVENCIIFEGANIEAGSSACGMCAERITIANCLLGGETPMMIAIATEGGHSSCGICRQFMLDFPDMIVYIVDSETGLVTKETTPRKLLPSAYQRLKQKENCQVASGYSENRNR